MKQIRGVAIIGAGFMGGSLAMALRKKFPLLNLSAYARSRQSLARLRKTGVFSLVSTDLEQVLAAANIIVLGSPVGAIIESFKKIKKFLKKGTIVTDLGSSKQAICKAATKILSPGFCFVGSHPLVGSEKSGIEFSRYDLYRGAVCIVTADKNSAASAIVSRLWQAVGSRVIFMPPARHDAMLSAISHLPHVISFALTDCLAREYMPFAPASLKDLTRIANSPAEIWADIFISNKNNLSRDIERFIVMLEKYKILIAKSNKQAMEKTIKRANRKQLELYGYRN